MVFKFSTTIVFGVLPNAPDRQYDLAVSEGQGKINLKFAKVLVTPTQITPFGGGCF